MEFYQVQIVSPDNVSVLRQRRTPSLTLVTCYPFYFVGDAPQRFIVQVALKEQAGAR
jgi:sortase A